MKIFLSAFEPEKFYQLALKTKVKNFLYSFYNLKKKSEDYIQERFNNRCIFLDSGGFTARMRGVQIDIKEYGNFISKYQDKILIAANLDTRSVEETISNQNYLSSISKKILPVYHHSDYVNSKYKSLLEDFIKEGYTYIGVGGMAGESVNRNKVMEFLNYVFSKTQNKIKVHGFGITSDFFLEKYPFYSCDSTSWQQYMRFGLMVQSNLKSRKLDKKQLMDISIPIENSDQYSLTLQNILHYINYEKYITNLWKARGIVWKD